MIQQRMLILNGVFMGELWGSWERLCSFNGRFNGLRCSKTNEFTIHSCSIPGCWRDHVTCIATENRSYCVDVCFEHDRLISQLLQISFPHPGAGAIPPAAAHPFAELGSLADSKKTRPILSNGE